MKGWGWFLLGAVLAAVGVLFWASQRSAAATHNWQDSLTTTRTVVAARDSQLTNLTRQLDALGPARDSAQHALDAAATLAAALSAAHGAAAAAEGRAKASLNAALSAHDSVVDLQTALIAADQTIATDDSTHSVFATQLAASAHLLAIVRDSNSMVVQQKTLLQQNADDWHRRATQADSLLDAKTLAPPKIKLLGLLIPLPTVKPCAAAVLTTKGELRAGVGLCAVLR